MKWYRKLYLGRGLEGKKDKLIKKLECNAGAPGLYVVTLAANGKDLFDIFSADMLLIPVTHGHCPLIVGLAKRKKEAIEMTEEIIMSCWRETGKFDVWAYLKGQAEMDGEAIEEYPMDKLRRRGRGLFRKNE